MVRRTLIALIAVLAAAALAIPASAAEKAGVAEYQLQYQPYFDEAQGLLIVTAIIDPQASLPASVTIPVPTGARILWVGEILGGDVTADPERTPIVETSGQMQLLTITAEKSRIVQAEIVLLPAVVDGKAVRSQLTWTNPGPDEVPVSASVHLEANISNVSIEPPPAGQPRANAIGEVLYSLGPLRLAQGQSYAISLSYDRGPASASRGPLLPILGGALAVAVVALIVVLVRQRQETAGATAEVSPRPEATTAEETPAEVDDDLERVTDDETFMDLD